MKIIYIALALAFAALPALADTYTGVVSGVKRFASGGVSVDIDGLYPAPKMTLYVSLEDA